MKITFLGDIMCELPVRKLKNVFKNPDTRYQIAKALGSDAERKALQKEIKRLYGRITCRALTGDIVREEYDLPERLG